MHVHVHACTCTCMDMCMWCWGRGCLVRETRAASLILLWRYNTWLVPWRIILLHWFWTTTYKMYDTMYNVLQQPSWSTSTCIYMYNVSLSLSFYRRLLVYFLAIPSQIPMSEGCSEKACVTERKGTCSSLLKITKDFQRTLVFLWWPTVLLCSPSPSYWPEWHQLGQPDVELRLKIHSASPHLVATQMEKKKKIREGGRRGDSSYS